VAKFSSISLGSVFSVQPLAISMPLI